MHRFEAVSDVWNRAPDDDAHRIIQVRGAHLVLDADGLLVGRTGGIFVGHARFAAGVGPGQKMAPRPAVKEGLSATANGPRRQAAERIFAARKSRKTSYLQTPSVNAFELYPPPEFIMPRSGVDHVRRNSRS